jgi:flagellar hook assembly protein FlgD
LCQYHWINNFFAAIEKQQTTIEKLQADIDDLKIISASTGTTNQSSAISKEGSGLSVAHLNQNAPNPFNSTTVISYYLPETKQNASIEIVSSNGQLVKTLPLTQKGNGQLSIKAREFSAGTYYYILKVDGVKADSKQMVLVK